MIYSILFIVGFIEEILMMSYYRLAHKGYKVACGIVNMVHIFLWAFVIQMIFKDLSNTFWVIFSYALGSGIGDWISLAFEVKIDKIIFKLKHKGKRKKRFYLIHEKKV
jgi:hypothetical protein